MRTSWPIALLGLLGLVSSALLSGCGGTAQAIPWTPDYEGSLRQAQQTQRPVLTYLYTDSCTYCKQMEATTFQDPLLLEDMRESYLWVKLNAETDPTGIQLREKFGVSDYPTIFVMDQDGSEIDRLTGYVVAEDFKSRIEDFLTSPLSFKRLQETIGQEPGSVQAHFELAHKYLIRSSLLNAAKHFVQVIVSDPANRGELTDTSYYWLAYTLATGSQPEEALRQLESLATKFPDSPARAEGYILEGQIHTFADRIEPARKALQAFLADFPDNEKRPWVEQLLKELRPNAALASSH